MRYILIWLCCATAWGQTVLWTDSSPKFPKVGDRFRFRVKTSTPAATRVTLASGTTETAFTLIGDQLWEIELVAPSVAPREVFSKPVGSIQLYQGQTITNTANAIVHPVNDELPPVSLIRLADDAQRSDWVINLRSPEFYDRMLGSADLRIFPEIATTRLYQILNADEFDFINVIVGSLDLSQNRYHVAVQNTVQGIGRNQFNAISTYGSRGRLLGLNVFPNIHLMDPADLGATHEIGHQWINYLTAQLFSGTPHWPISSMATGVMGYSDPVNNQGLNFPCTFSERPGGGYTGSTRGNRVMFNDFDLYLMGLIAPSEVRPQFLVVDQNKINALRAGRCEDIAVGQYLTLTVDDIIRGAGARVPSSASSPKVFRTLNLVVTRDTLLSANEMAFFEFMARRNEEKGLIPISQGLMLGFGHPFAEATGRKGEISTKLTTAVLPEIDYGGVTNAASYANDAVAPFSVGTIFGKNLNGGTVSASNVPLPTTLSATRVFVNGKAMPLFYVSPTQINFQIPADLPVTPVVPADQVYLASVRVDRGGFQSNVAYFGVRANAPGIIATADGYMVAQDSSYRVVGKDVAAKAGEAINFYFVGASELSEPPPAVGTAAPMDRLVRVTSPVQLRIGSLNVIPSFIGLTPGGVGLQQVNFTLPASMSAGEYVVTLTIGGRASNSVKLVVRN